MLFIQNKYTKWYYQIIENAQSQNRIKITNDGNHVHHIIPRSFGGSDHVDNLVILSYKEHKTCHHLLIHMTNGKYKHKMMYAYKFFQHDYPVPSPHHTGAYTDESARKMVRTRKENGTYLTGKDNNFAKPEIIQQVKQRMKENNPMKDANQRERMRIRNNSPYSNPVMVNGTIFPTLKSAMDYYQISQYLLEKNHNVVRLVDNLPAKKFDIPDKYITPVGIFKTKKSIQQELGIPEHTLNNIYRDLDAYPNSSGRGSKRIEHLNLDYDKTWRENGFDMLS